MSVTNNGKQKRNKKKKRLIKLLIIVIILFILLMLADTLLLQHRKNVDREQRKDRSNRGTGKSSHCNTDTCSYTHTYPNADSYGNTNTCTGKGICF